MKKGNKRKEDIQKVTKELILEKGYSAVTMSDICLRLNLSAGGLYYHYHTVEEIFFDIAASETKDVWAIFHEVHDIDSLLAAFRQYFELEKADMLNYENTFNAMLYQYYFSFPAEARKSIMQTDYIETTGKIAAILEHVYRSEKVVRHISRHIYVMLHGLNIIAMTGQLEAETIEYEFKETEILMRRLFSESEET